MLLNNALTIIITTLNTARAAISSEGRGLTVGQRSEAGGRTWTSPGRDAILPRLACTLGAWQCQGQELQRCYNDRWNKVQTCDGTLTICQATNPLVAPGCVWAGGGVVSGGANLPSTSAPPVVGPTTSAGGGPSVSISLPPIASSSGGAGNTTGGGPSGSVSAPHYVIYHNRYSRTLPASAADIKPWNRFFFAFWQTDVGAADGAAEFSIQMDAAARQAMIADFHANGISIMVAAFGGVNYPTTEDPVGTAKKLAAYVKEHGLDGCDIDYEDSGAFITGTAVAWVIAFQTELRKLLPPPYIISHAPQPPYMAEGQFTAVGGGYKAIHEAVGDGIDFYNVQFYNQMSIKYDTCETLISTSGDKSSMMEIAAFTGIPLNKLVLGKPLNSEDVANTGVMTAPALAPCYAQLKGKGWNAGLMLWQWKTGEAVQYLKTAAGI